MTDEKSQKQNAPSAALQKDIEENKYIALLSYLGVLFIVPLLVKKESAYAVYHAKQGMLVFIATTISSLALSVFAVFAIVPFLGIIIFFMFFSVWAVVMMILLVIDIIGLYNALTGKMKPLPIIGPLADKFNL